MLKIFISSVQKEFVAERAAKGERERETSQNTVTTTDAEIDHLVYELYGLTPEEIKIVDPALHEATQGKGGGA